MLFFLFFIHFFYRIFCMQTVETLNAVSDLGLHYLHMSLKKDAMLIWVKDRICNPAKTVIVTV